MTPARIWIRLIVVFVGLMLASCQTVALKPPAKIFQAGDFKPLMINARRLEIIDSWTMPMTDPHVGHRANPLPINSLAAWASRVCNRRVEAVRWCLRFAKLRHPYPVTAEGRS